VAAKTSYNPELLDLFTRTAERGSIAAAARSMDLSPSLATKKIAQLESGQRLSLDPRLGPGSRLENHGLNRDAEWHFATMPVRR
jgi:DNA-binding transcriptional LysR family regulator